MCVLVCISCGLNEVGVGGLIGVIDGCIMMLIVIVILMIVMLVVLN